MTSDRLFVQVVGPPKLIWCGEELPRLRRKSMLLVCILAVHGRAMARAELAAMLWGPGKLGNLRQELRALRGAPGADMWLDAGPTYLSVHAQTDLAQAEQGGDAPGATALGAGGFMEGVDDQGQVGLGDWLEEQAQRLDALRLGRDGQGGAPLVVPLDAVWRMDAASEHAPPAQVLARALGLPLWAVLEARAKAPLDTGRGSDDPELRAILARAWIAETGPSLEGAERLVRAGLELEGSEVLLGLARQGNAHAAEALTRLAAPPSVLAEGHRWVAELASRRGQREVVQAHAVALRRVARDSQDPTCLFESALVHARICFLEGNRDGAARHAREASELAQRHGDAVARDRAALWRGHTMNDVDALREASNSSDPGTRLSALSALGAYEAQRGSTQAGLELHRLALAGVRDLADADGAARMLNNLGATFDRGGQVVESMDCFEDAVALAKNLGDPELLATSRLNHAEMLRRTGALGPFRRVVAEVLAQSELAGRHRAGAFHRRVDLEEVCGRQEEAVRWAQRAADEWDDLGDHDNAYFARFNLARVGGASFGELQDRLQQVGRADLRALGWGELARAAPDLQTCDHALSQSHADPVGAAVARVKHGVVQREVLEGVPIDHTPVELTLAWHQLGEHSRVAALLPRHLDGLMPAQAQGLRARFSQ